MALGIPDRDRCTLALDALFTRFDGIDAAMLALRDGRPFVQRIAQDIDAGRFAAMTSSLAALGRSVLKELKAGNLDHVLIEGNAGKLVITLIPGSDGLLLLAVLAKHDARLGLVLGQAKLCAQAISAAIPDAHRR